MSNRENTRDCILTTLKSALHERFQYLPSSMKIHNLEEHIEHLAINIEFIVYNYTQRPHSIIKHMNVNGIPAVDVIDGAPAASDEDTFPVYLAFIADFVVRISPAFYTGRHNFTFRDMLVKGEIPANILDIDMDQIWPEVYADDTYLFNDEYNEIMHTYSMEKTIAARGILLLIDQCCKTDICTADQRKEKLVSGGIFEEGSPFVESLNTVCFGKSNACWEKSSGKITLPCNNDDGICPTIPPEAKNVITKIDASRYFSSCMMYEDFLQSLAKDGMQNIMEDPLDPSHRPLPYLIVNTLRNEYEKEMKMMRYYMDTKQMK